MIFYLLKLDVNLEDQRNNDLLLKKGTGGEERGCKDVATLLIVQGSWSFRENLSKL